MNSHLDRRTIKDRRIVSPARRAGGSDNASLVVAILPPEQQAAQVERIFERVPYDKRRASGLSYEHVRLVLDALR